MASRRTFEVIVIGGGPAGMAAAVTAAQAGRQTALVDGNPKLGGQIWRAGMYQDPKAVAWRSRLDQAGVTVLANSQVVAMAGANELLVEADTNAGKLVYDKLVIAAGARERFLPFPGWTLPNVMGVGGLQLMAKSGFPVKGKRVVVAGSGPLLLAVAAYLRQRGASVSLIAEQASWMQLIQFSRSLATAPAKCLQAARYKLQTLGVRYRAGTWPIAARGDKELQEVVLRAGSRTWTQPCDYLACGFGLTPNLELPNLLGCEIVDGFVRVDANQETSVKNVYCVGEPTGIGGVDKALVEGRIAGCVVAGKHREAAGLFNARRRLLRFSQRMESAFALRKELRESVTQETIVCRCEDVAFGQLATRSSWRDAKLHTRCGMGPCQGRVCGPAIDHLFGWRHTSCRPPILPTTVEVLAHCGLSEEQG